MTDLPDDVNYTDVIVEALTRFPRRTAFVQGDREYTYAETAAMISQFMQALDAGGIRAGVGVSVLSKNVPEVWMIQAAAYLLGCRYIALHPMGSVADHAFICEDAGVELLIVHADLAEHGAAVAEKAASVSKVYAIGKVDGVEDIASVLSRHQASKLSRRRVERDDTHWIAYTGGTTGRSKGVLIPDRALMKQVQTVITSLCLPEVPRYLAVAPISHAGVLPIVPTLARGGTVILKSGFDPEDWLRTVQDHRANWAFLAPTMIYGLLDKGGPEKFDLSSLETLMYGSSPMSPFRIAEAQETLGPVLLQAYGQTECVSFATILRKDEHDAKNRPDLLSSCGRPVIGMRVELLDDDGQPVADGEIGEICVRGPGVMKGYHNLPDETAAALAGDWLHTGDLATRDDEGFLHIVERKKDMIISGGFNVYSREIEDVIAQVNGVSSVAVIGVPDERWGEAVKAVVVPRPGEAVDTALVIDTVRKQKGRHQAPKTVEIVETLPVTAVGKIDKRALRDRYWENQSRNVN